MHPLTLLLVVPIAAARRDETSARVASHTERSRMHSPASSRARSFCANTIAPSRAPTSELAPLEHPSHTIAIATPSPVMTTAAS